MKPKIGDKLWLVREGWRSSDAPREREVTVTKVGNKWFQLDNDHDPRHPRYSNDTWCEDGGQYMSRAKCHGSADEYHLAIETAKTWDKVYTLIRNTYSRPEHLTLLDIQTVLKILHP